MNQMASTKEMMARAKARKQPPKQKIISKPNKILAIRHTADGQQEFCAFEISINGVLNDKNALLHHICVKDWLHTPPTDAIGEYLLQTNTYKEFKSKGIDATAWIINFHELDHEATARRGEKTYSCRLIMAIPEENWREAVELYKDSLDDNVMDVRSYQ
jgi:hypothetical protein